MLREHSPGRFSGVLDQLMIIPRFEFYSQVRIEDHNIRVWVNAEEAKQDSSGSKYKNDSATPREGSP